ncbi:cell division protein FtsB [Haliea sp. E1-2-M8]|uniref:cell division protein FtsB n=1 Tax=Haliea sp. E1-2-M8 TaxID=3064706 RepID=UPI002717E366|nr:cell division protein FtsB [Haliea sp. E1-2-M8]MDO8861251.1 cell division protein FtsB [Haliea sp. E1-2-M8]
MKYLLVALVALLGVLQYRLWIAEGSLAEKHRLQREVEAQQAVNRELEARNAVLEREVLDLQTGNDGLEQRAREQLGLVREGEIFYQFVPESERPAASVGSDHSRAVGTAKASAVPTAPDTQTVAE